MSRSQHASGVPRFPTTRMRRLRQHPGIRALVRSTVLDPGKLILPLFVRPGSGVRQPIGSLPGHAQISPDLVAAEVREAAALGLGGVLFFGIPESKDPTGRDSWDDNGVVQQALRAAREVAGDLPLVSDVCFCEYTDHGHCGQVGTIGGRSDVDNDATLERLAQQAVSHARAGADLVAPSGMMDGMVGAIRGGLDAAGFAHVPIMSYAAKFASALYGPFREAAECAPQFGDRRTYQMDPAVAVGQAVREVELDVAEGADLVMVKPALAYLDVVQAVAAAFPGVPLAAYQVSGEYSMVKAAAERGWLDERASALECLTAIHRAGAEIVITYWAKDVARWLGA